MTDDDLFIVEIDAHSGAFTITCQGVTLPVTTYEIRDDVTNILPNVQRITRLCFSIDTTRFRFAHEMRGRVVDATPAHVFLPEPEGEQQP